LEEALIAFPGVVLVVSHDRYFLNRVCTDILAFEGHERIAHSSGDYDYYLEKRAKQPPITSAPAKKEATPTPKAAPTKPRKLTWKEMKELEGMEARIMEVETEIARIEELFASPDFHRTHAVQTNQLKADLAAAKATLAQIYARWEELEVVRLAFENKPAT